MVACGAVALFKIEGFSLTLRVQLWGCKLAESCWYFSKDFHTTARSLGSIQLNGGTFKKFTAMEAEAYYFCRINKSSQARRWVKINSVVQQQVLVWRWILINNGLKAFKMLWSTNSKAINTSMGWKDDKNWLLLKIILQEL